MCPMSLASLHPCLCISGLIIVSNQGKSIQYETAAVRICEREIPYYIRGPLHSGGCLCILPNFEQLKVRSTERYILRDIDHDVFSKVSMYAFN